ncbi:MAG: hypothetical protein IIC03_04255 [Proteobacteria bacterium]|nr:hypothetical protein [Pseudomonadota bacterium]
MSAAIHGQAPHHLPIFLPGADGSDILFTVVVVMMIVMVFGFGVLYFTLHALPEKIAHGTSSTQFQLIAVLALLAMFTHNNLFWVAALLLATIKLPDFTTPLNAISRTLAEIRDREPAPLEVSVVMPVSQPEPEAPEAPEEPEAAEAPEADQSGEPADA